MLQRVWDGLRRERTRAYIYRGLVGTAPVLVAYGLVSDQEAFVWLACAAAWLGNVQASANSSTATED